jgi:hypothetical protein
MIISRLHRRNANLAAQLSLWSGFGLSFGRLRAGHRSVLSLLDIIAPARPILNHLRRAEAMVSGGSSSGDNPAEKIRPITGFAI